MLKQARLIDQAQERAAKRLALHRLATTAASNTNPGATLNLILTQVPLLLGRGSGTLAL